MPILLISPSLSTFLPSMLDLQTLEGANPKSHSESHHCESILPVTLSCLVNLDGVWIRFNPMNLNEKSLNYDFHID
jgi:hypothetical protein